jgi:hypothetical protein
MTKLIALTLTKADFDRIPADQRLFYFLAGQLQSPQRSAALAQVILLLKLTAGRLYEGHKMINENFSAKGFLNKYASELSPNTLESLSKLNKYFGGKSAIQRIRTKFAFHLDAQSIAAAYANVPNDFTSVEYLSEKYAGHNLFHTSETLSIIAIIGNKLDKWQSALDSIVEEITDTCVTMGIFLSGVIGLILTKYLGVTNDRLMETEITIADEAPIDALRLPFFCLPPRTRG